MAFMEEEKPIMAVEGNIKILKTLDLNSDGMCVRFSPDGQRLAVGLSSGIIKIFKSDTMACIYQLSDEETISAHLPVTSLCFVKQDKKGDMLIATYASGQVKFWHVSSGKALYTIHEPRQVLNSSLSNDNRKVTTVGSTDQVHVYDVHSGKQIRLCEPSPNVLVMDGHRSRVFSIKHHPVEEELFITGGWDDTIQFWDHRQERAVRHLFGPHICGDGLDIDPKYNHILSASWRKHDALQVWDFKSGGLIKTIPADFGNESCLYSCQWLGKNHIVCGGCDGNMLRIIDKTTLATSGQLTGLSGGVYSIDYDHSRKTLAHHGPAATDITTIAALVCKNLFVLSNAAVPQKN